MDAQGEGASAAEQETLQISPLLAAIALVVWSILTFGHGIGLKLAGGLFAWAKVAGNLHPEGGTAGLARLETIMALVFGSIAIAVVGFLGYRLRKVDLPRLVEAAVPWMLWAVLTFLIWKCFIVYATEMVHFAQYALVGLLVALALDRGKHPQKAFLITFALGFLDEVWQHYGLHAGDPHHWMDWSDPVLDALGAAGGILPFVTLMRLRGEKPPPTFHLVKRAVLVCALLFLPLLLLDPVAVSKTLGHYRLYPFWGEYENHKPTHWPNPREGIPLILASILVIGTLIEPRKRPYSQTGMLVLAVLLVLAINPTSRLGGMPVHEDVPHVQAPWTAGPISVDGVLDEPAWSSAPRLGPFVNNQDGEAVLSLASGDPIPLQATYARVLWSDAAVYFAFEVSDTDIWARDTHRDDTTLPGDEVVEVFLDDGGDEVTYYEVEVSPQNVVYDLFNLIPAAPLDFNPDNKFLGLPNWDARGLQTAVKVDGTLDLAGFGVIEGMDRDRGYVVEMAIPWENFKTTTTPAGNTVRRSYRPEPGERWRLGLYRVERPRIDKATLREGAPPVSRDQALKLIGCTEDQLDYLIRKKRLKPPEGSTEEGLFRAQHVQEQVALRRIQYQAWAPTYDVSFHQPPRFGVIEFVKESSP